MTVRPTPPASGCQPGLVLLGHGTRNPLGHRQFLETYTALMPLLPGVQVRYAFLEAAQPCLLETLLDLADRGAPAITVAPLLLLAAGHLRRDIPAALARFQNARPQTPVACLPVLGCHARIVDLMAQQVDDMLRDAGARPAETCLLVVGRGSPQGQTNRALARLAQQVAGRIGAGQWRIGLLAMAEPGLDAVRAELTPMSYRWVVVKPHLLFEGTMVNQLRQSLGVQEPGAGRQQWLVGAPLGGGVVLAGVVADRYGAWCRRRAGWPSGT